MNETFEVIVDGWTVRGWPYFDFTKEGSFTGCIDADGDVCFEVGPYERGRDYRGDTAYDRTAPWSVVSKAREIWEANRESGKPS